MTIVNKIVLGAEKPRESKGIPLATHEGEISLFNVKIPCCVLDNKMRIIVPSGMYLSSHEGFSDEERLFGAAIKEMLADLSLFPPSLNLEEFVSDELKQYLVPVRFSKKNGDAVYGYDARALPEICMVYIIAEEAGVIPPDQKHLVNPSKRLSYGLFMVGRKVAGC